MKFLTNFIKEHRTLALTVFVGVLLAVSGIYLAITQIFAVIPPSTPDWVWVNSTASTDPDFGKAVTSDSFGFVYVAGEFIQSIDFTSVGCGALSGPAAQSSIYLAKFDSTGACIWAMTPEVLNSPFTGGDAFVNDIVVSASTSTSGNIFITGKTFGFVSSGSGDQVNGGTVGFLGSLAFATKIGFSEGPFAYDVLWSSIVADDDSNENTGSALSLDSFSNTIAYTGSFGDFNGQLCTATTEFTPPSGPTNNSLICDPFTNLGNQDIFVAQLDADTGSFLWPSRVENAGGIADDVGLGIHADGGDIFVSGTFILNATFDPFGLNETIVPAISDQDGFVAKYDGSTGDLVWVRAVGGNQNDTVASSLQLNSTNDLYLTGLFYGDATVTYHNFLRMWGSAVNGGSGPEICTSNSCSIGVTGTGLGGEFLVPGGIAATTGGDTYVADTGNKRVQLSDPSGNFIRMWGSGVNGGSGPEICTGGSCVPGVAGTGLGGEFNEPYFTAVDPVDGSVYVTDTAYNRVSKFTAAGVHLFTIGEDVDLADPNLDGVNICSTILSGGTSDETCQPGASTGGEKGEFFGAGGVTVDSNGDFYVADLANHRIQKFDSSGNFILMFGDDVKIAPPPPLPTTILALAPPTFEDICLAADTCQPGVAGIGSTSFDGPLGLAVDSNDDIYIADTNNDRIQKFDLNGNPITSWGSIGISEGTFDSPIGVAVDSNDHIFVTEQSPNHRVQEFDSDGNFINMFGRGVKFGITDFQLCTSGCQAGTSGTGSGHFNSPYGIGIDADDNIYVVDRNNKRIQIFNTQDNLGVVASSFPDIFVTKLDSVTSDFIWSRRAGDGGVAYPSLTLGPSDSVFIGGNFEGTATFDDGLGGTEVGPTTAGSADALVFGYSSGGILDWYRSAGGNLIESINSIVFDVVNTAWYVTGFYDSDPATFGTASGSPLANLDSPTSASFVAQLMSAPIILTPPVFSKSFSPSTITVGGTSTLTFTIDNSVNPGSTINDIDFTDDLPPEILIDTGTWNITFGETVFNLPEPGNNCFVSTIDLVPPSNGIFSVTDFSVQPGAICTISVDVSSVTPSVVVGPGDDWTNTTSDLTSIAGNSGSASATLTVNPPAGGPPIITTGPATNITTNSATLNGTWNGNGASSSAFPNEPHFDLYTNALTFLNSYIIAEGPQDDGTGGTASISASVPPGDLSPNTTYQYRAVGTNANGTTNGPLVSFTTNNTTSGGGSQPKKVDGVCDLANGGTFSVAPQTYLCSKGTLSSAGVTGPTNGKWNWTCEGSGINHQDASCSANVQLTTVSCGSANGGTFQTKPSTGLCAPNEGTPSTVNGPTNGFWNWLCYIPQSQPLIKASCSAKGPLPPPTFVCVGWVQCCKLPKYKNNPICIVPPPGDGDELGPPNPIFPGGLTPPNPLFPSGGGTTPTGGGTPAGGTPSGGPSTGPGGQTGPAGGGTGRPSAFVNGILTSILPSNVVSQITNALNDRPGVIADIVSTFGLILGAISTAVAALSISTLVFSDLPLLPLKLWSALLSFLGVRKEQKWGYVISSATQEGIDPAYVVLFDEAGKEVATGITDLEGRYGFPVPKPGVYTMVANKGGYDAFPSKKLAGQTSTSLYKDLYFGGPIEIKEAGQIITKNIPLDPLNFDWNQIQKNKLGRYTSRTGRAKLIAKISNFFFAIGFVVAALSLIFAPKYYNIAIFALYVLLFVLRHYSVLKAKKKGKIMKGGLPLPFSVLRVYQASVPDVEVAHSVANQDGSFYRLIPNGRYIAKIDEMVSEGVYNPVFTSAPFEVKNGIINTHFSIQ